MQTDYKLNPGSAEAQKTSVRCDTTFVVPGFDFMKQRGVPIPKTSNFFINKSGEVIMIQNGSEKFVPVFFRGNKRPIVKIGSRGECELIYLMLECFKIEYNPTDRIKYKVDGSGRIPLSSIKITPTKKRSKSYMAIADKDEKLIKMYQCGIKAFSANARGSGIISPYEILQSLKITNYKCFYCGCGINENSWHLDHFIPMSKKGKNEFKNIVPSCPECNIMKLDILPQSFIERCRKIVMNFDKHNL